MSLMAICQRCGKSDNHWNIHQAEFHVGGLSHWKVQLCEKCTLDAEEAVRVALTADSRLPASLKE